MDLVQTQDARSPSSDPVAIGQKPPKRAYCDACPWRRSNESEEFTIKLEELAVNGADCRSCQVIFEFLSGQRGQDGMPYLGLHFHWKAKFWAPQFSAYTSGASPAWRMDQFFAFFAPPSSGTSPTYEFFTANDADLGPPSGDTSSTEAFETLKGWISRCEEEHSECQQANDNPLPHRVLKIEGIQPLRVRLVENYPGRQKYACLSHRWGPQTEPNSLKAHNLSLFKMGVPEENFYPLIRDAIEAAFRLDLHFIWIDCYCIIQDDIKDWERAAGQMASIYEDAFLTISATASQGGQSMFSTIRQPFAGVQVTEFKGQPIFLRQELRTPYSHYVTSSSLDRGWVFQEQLLSKRFIHFLEDEIFWECRESRWCECTPTGADWRSKMYNRRTIQGMSWTSIAEDYLKTKLTFETDRVPALAGVARRHAELKGLTYLAGLWKEYLPDDLKWHCWNPSGRPRPLEHVAPTWSWLSLPRNSRCEFHYSDPEESSDSIRSLQFNPESQDADVYTGATHLEVVVEAPVMDLKVYKTSEGDGDMVIGRGGGGLLLMRKDFEFYPEDPTKYCSVPEGSSCLLLVIRYKHIAYQRNQGILLREIGSTESDVAKYERIGFFDDKDLGHMDPYAARPFNDCGPGGPSFPDLQYDTSLDDNNLGAASWLLERSEIRKITII